MFIAHLPAGYLLTRILQSAAGTRKFLWLGLIASILPDIDMLYFYLVDNQQTLHHHYWTHLPLVWFAAWALVAVSSIIFKQRTVLIGSTIFFANIILHFVLDTIVGGINWLYPLVDHDLFLVTVPATHDYWVWSFVFHWTFLLEIIILIAALVLWRKTHRVTRAKQESADGNNLPDERIADIAAEYNTTIDIPAVKHAQPWILCAIGLVGSGKTTVIKPLSKHLNLYRISTDQIRLILRKHGYNYLRTRDVAVAITQKAGANGYSLAIDGDSMAPENRASLVELCAKTGMRQVWIHINPPEEWILNKLRNTVQYTSEGIFKNADEAVANYFRRKPLHEQHLSEITFDFAFDTSRDDLEKQIDNFVRRYNKS